MWKRMEVVGKHPRTKETKRGAGFWITWKRREKKKRLNQLVPWKLIPMAIMQANAIQDENYKIVNNFQGNRQN